MQPNGVQHEQFGVRHEPFDMHERSMHEKIKTAVFAFGRVQKADILFSLALFLLSIFGVLRLSLLQDEE